MFKNIILASFVALVLVVGASQSVVAQTSSIYSAEVQAKIDAFMARIAELTAQLNALRASNAGYTTPAAPVASYPGNSKRICRIALRPFFLGEENDDVSAFQEFLQSEGYFDRMPTGYFGEITRRWLMRWQAAQGLEAVGIVGPRTMGLIRAWCNRVITPPRAEIFSAFPTNGSAPLTVTFKSMVGGFRPAGITYTIEFGDGTSERANECSAPADACLSPGTNTHTYAMNGTYNVTLNKMTDLCPDDGDPGTPRCLAAVRGEVIGRVQIVVGPGIGFCTKEYAPVCGSKPIVCITTPCNPIQQTYGNRCMMHADGASFLYTGECRSDVICPAIAYQRPICTDSEIIVPVNPDSKCPGPWKCVPKNDPGSDPQCKRWTDGKYCGMKCSREVPGGTPACAIPACMYPGPITPPDGVPQCLEYFTNDTNRPPTISGLSGPTILAVNTNGTWTVSASDPEGGTLSYNIWWGDEQIFASGADSLVSPRQFTQATSFTHAYAQAGTYTITVVVRDSAGKEARTTTTVQVGHTPVACTMEYNPVCGRPPGCAPCNASGGLSCPAICQLHNPQTYGNRCALGAVNATFLHTGECTSSSGNWY